MVKLYNALDESIIMPLTMSWTTLSRGRRVPITEILAGGGVLSGEEKPEVRTFSVSGSIYYQNYSEMRSFLDDLLLFLENSPIRVYQDETDNRFIYARLLSATDNWLDNRAELELTLEFIASDPYFYSVEHVEIQQLTNSPLEFPVYVGGNLDVYPFILINKNSGTLESLEIENLTTSRNIKFTENISSDITIDNKNILVLAGDTSILSEVNTEWLVDTITLSPGENNIKITSDGTFDYTVYIKWRSKWL